MKLITISAVITITVLVLVLSERGVENNKSVIKHKVESSFDFKNAASDLVVQQQTNNRIVKNEITAFVQQPNKKINSNNTLWDVVVEAKKNKVFPYQNPRNINYHYLKLNRSVISKLKSGDEFNFYVPLTKRDYYGIVSQVKLSDSGINSYFGTLINHGRQYTFNITQGPDTTHASFNTPDGLFAIESHAGDAWINDTQDERRSLDYSKSDVINPSTQFVN